MTADRAMNWVLGIAFVLMTGMFWISVYKADSTKTATITMDGAVITVRCEEQPQ